MKRPSRFILYSGIVLFICMLLSLLMMSDALTDSSRFNRLYSGLLIFTSVGLCSLVALIVLNLRRLIHQRLNQTPGTRMTVRMIGMFATLSVVPVLIVYLFSLDFLHRGIDSWFDLRVEQALDSSLKLSRLSFDTRMRELLKQTEQIAREVAITSRVEIPFVIDKLRTRENVREVTLFDKQGSIITSSAEDTASIIPNRPSDSILLQLQQGGNYVGLDNIAKTGLHIRVVVNLHDVATPQILQALYPISEETNALTNSIQTSYIKYKELSYLREQLKLSFIVVLTLVLLFSVFASVWTAFYVAEQQVVPITNMVQATQTIAKGDDYVEIPITRNDELGFLVTSFNNMAKKIARARRDAAASQHEAETQHAYLEAVLGRLSSGVLVFEDRHLRTSNISTSEILGFPIERLIGQSLDQIARMHPNFATLRDVILTHDNMNRDWREQITLFSRRGRQILMCSGTPHPFNDTQGCIIVFDDITQLIQGQKDAAWSEMARRLAHEIKNPLTPIQLATERLRHKYLPTMKAADADTLDRLTNTIIQQVTTMREMVNAFSDYARPSMNKPQAVDINMLINEVLDLFAETDQKTRIVRKLDPTLPMINADIGKLRRVFNNLIKNAFDASAMAVDPTLTVISKYGTTTEKNDMEIVIKDFGSGVSQDMLTHVFEPYVTSKAKGSGLGLAIVKKIIEEHQGIVWLQNNTEMPGASAIIRLPLPENLSQYA